MTPSNRRVWFSPHGTEWEAETYEEALEQERDALVQQLETLRAAAVKTLHEYDLWAEGANDGEFAIWSREEFMASFIVLRRALSNPASNPYLSTDVAGLDDPAGAIQRMEEQSGY